MSSILTNMGAMSALQSLNATQKNLAGTQNQVSSGLRVADASDNAAYWSIATTMKGDTSALSSVSDALNLGASVVATATAAVNSTLSIMYKLKADLVTAQTPGTSTAQVQTDVAAQQQSLLNIISSASFNGVNLLDGSAGATTSVVASFSRSGTGASATANLGTIAIATGTAASTIGGTQLTGTNGILGTAITDAASAAITSGTGTASTAWTTGATPGNGVGTAAQGASGGYAAGSILAFDVTSMSSTDMATVSAGIDKAISNITAAGAALGAAKTNITNQLTFVSALSDAITSGVGSLVDADMNQASTRLNALQTQQQLGVQSLSIANQNAQLILKLFQ